MRLFESKNKKRILRNSRIEKSPYRRHTEKQWKTILGIEGFLQNGYRGKCRARDQTKGSFNLNIKQSRELHKGFEPVKIRFNLVERKIRDKRKRKKDLEKNLKHFDKDKITLQNLKVKHIQLQ